MDFIISLFDINTILIEILGYKISVIELIGTLFGLSSVWLAMRANIHTWSTGVFNGIVFFALYYQVQLYSDMFLQVFFLISSLYGWWKWTKIRPTKQDRKITYMGWKTRYLTLFGILFFTFAWGYLMSQIHILLPSLFPKAAAFPFADAFTTVLSIFATLLMAYKKIESWVLWITVDVVSVYLYFLSNGNWRTDYLD